MVEFQETVLWKCLIGYVIITMLAAPVCWLCLLCLWLILGPRARLFPFYFLCLPPAPVSVVIAMHRIQRA
jgi:hypothetical protein